MQRTWSDSYGYVLIATGRAEVMLDPQMSTWDCGALLPVLREAGGTFTDWKGTSTVYGGDAIATNQHVYEELMQLV
jgi:fructose-1,6-bisphosphatase/inositol monophosphatase family enzyme